MYFHLEAKRCCCFDNLEIKIAKLIVIAKMI